MTWYLLFGNGMVVGFLIGLMPMLEKGSKVRASYFEGYEDGKRMGRVLERSETASRETASHE